jgi:hypothetical protein
VSAAAVQAGLGVDAARRDHDDRDLHLRGGWRLRVTAADAPPAGAPDIRAPGGRPLTADEVRARVAAGARLVRFELCVSALVFTLRRQSEVYLTDTRRQRTLRGLWYSLGSLLLGPWGVPWGLVWTPWAVWVNLSGGVDETDAVLAWLDTRDNPPSHSPHSHTTHPDNRD